MLSEKSVTWATPYNYSDMTGLNNRVVNSCRLPLKGHWMIIDDSHVTNLVWHTVSWNTPSTNSAAVEVYARSDNHRTALSGKPFIAVTNQVSLAYLTGRYLEVRMSIKREAATNQIAMGELTVVGYPPQP